MVNLLSPVKYLQGGMNYLRDSFVVETYQRVWVKGLKERAIKIRTRRALYDVLRRPSKESIEEARWFADDNKITRLVRWNLTHEIVIKEIVIKNGSLDRYCQIFGSPSEGNEQTTKGSIQDLYENGKREVQQLIDLKEILNRNGLEDFMKAQEKYQLLNR